MFKSSKNGITITCILDTRHQRKNGKYPIKIRVTYKSKSWYCSVGQSILKENWSVVQFSNDPVFAEIKGAVENYYLLVRSYVDSLVEKNLFSLQQLRHNVRKIKHISNKFHQDNHIFPTIKHTLNARTMMTRKNSFTKAFNQKLEIIGALLKIDDFTTVTARHSYATILKKNGVSIAFISESLGHKSINTTEHYLARFEKEERKKNVACLLDFE